MRLYVVDAFAAERFCGNQAGVALLDGADFPPDGLMRKLAAELKHSETAFVKGLSPGRYELRYFTPEGEVDLCGHATVAAFTVLREEDALPPGIYAAVTRAGELSIRVGPDAVWMDMAPPTVRRALDKSEAAAVYRAYGLPDSDICRDLPAEIISTGLADILLPVSSREALEGAVQDERAVVGLSEAFDVVGVHMFWLDPAGAFTARCRNFAPRYAIPEESATGTSNGALTYYLFRRGLLCPGTENRFLQGEHMGRPSEIRTRLMETREGPRVQVGGQGVIVLRCELL